MNRTDFDKLIASLRKEHEDEDGTLWTQERLAQEAKLAAGTQLFTKDVISSIERGRREPDGRTLLALADALQLTSGERREFFLAAAGVENDKIARQDYGPARVLSQLMERIGETRLPAHIVDSYCDIIAVNAALVELLEFESAGLGVGIQLGKRFHNNMIRFSFSDEGASHFEERMRESWPEYAYTAMMILRAFTLPYRSTKYFQALLRELKGSRQFRRHWREIYFYERDHIINNPDMRWYSPKWGPLRFLTAVHTAVTTAGDLHLCVYVPASVETAAVFSQLVDKTGPANTVCLGPSWPKKTVR